MVRKILIIFALIIAAFPYLGFSDTADLIVTTAFSLLIALALILGRKPKTIKTVQENNIEPLRRQETVVFTTSKEELKISHQENESPHNVSFVKNNKEIINSNNGNEQVFINNQPTVERQVEAPAPKVRMPRKRIVMDKPTDIVENVLVHEESSAKKEDAPSLNVMSIRKRQRKNISNTILAHEDSVPPADMPVRFE